MHAQERWLRGHPEHFDVLRRLPIFEMASSASQSSESAAPACFITLLGQAFIAPAGMPSSFVEVTHDADRGALQLLGVQPLSRSEVLRYILLINGRDRCSQSVSFMIVSHQQATVSTCDIWKSSVRIKSSDTAQGFDNRPAVCGY
jgi:hypothetical protein